jgi:plastocyanin
MKAIIKHRELKYVTNLKALSTMMIITLSILLFMAFSLLPLTVGNAVAESQSQPQPNIKATNAYQTHTMVLGNNIKNFVILIPNEAHESMNQPKNQLPLINQPYVPQNAVVNVGTSVTWFHADVDHKHTITLNDKNSGSNVFTSPKFLFNTATQPLTFNKTGTFEYFEKNVNNDVPNFVMNGTITAINQPSSISPSKQNSTATSTANTSIDTVGTYMVPAKDLSKDVAALTSRGLSVDSTFTYKDARGGEKGTGPEQTLIVWTSSGMTLDKIVSALKEVTPTLPYT